MKEQAHNEIDLMLRKLGSASPGAPENGNHASTSSNANEHLDADELNMYAENALPIKTRARYTEHLAECQQCRKMVSQLSQAAGIVIVEEKKEAIQKESPRSGFLVSLFSPMVLKYALPAVLLVAIASVGYVGFWTSMKRDGSTSNFEMARKTEQAPAVQSAPTQLTDNLSKTAEQVAAPQSSPAQPGTAKVGKEESKSDANKEAKGDAPKPVDSVASADAPPAPAPPVARHDVAAAKTAEAEEKRPASNEVAANRNAGISGPQTGSSNIANAQPREVAKNEGADKKREDDEADTRKAKTATAARGQTQARAEQQQQQQQQEPFRDRGRRRQDKDDEETRSVAGRYFRRESGVWIDSAYSSSQAMTRVSRGSEQFRALIADEPEIKRIADQLPGDVIVVWKGRVYRIQ